MASSDNIEYNTFIPHLVKLSETPPDDVLYPHIQDVVMKKIAEIDSSKMVANLKILALMWNDVIRDCIVDDVELHISKLDEDLQKVCDAEEIMKLLDVFLMPPKTSKSQAKETPQNSGTTESSEPKRKRQKN